MVTTSDAWTDRKAPKEVQEAVANTMKLRTKVAAMLDDGGLKLGDCGHYALETKDNVFFPDNDDIPRLWCFICHEYRFWDIDIQMGFNGS